MKIQAHSRSQRGSAVIEYALVTASIALILVVAGAHPSAIAQLLDALRKAYTSFVYALSAAWF